MEVIRRRTLREEVDTEINRDPCVYGEIEKVVLTRREFSSLTSYLDRWQSVIAMRKDCGTLSNRAQHAQVGDYFTYNGTKITVEGY